MQQKYKKFKRQKFYIVLNQMKYLMCREYEKKQLYSFILLNNKKDKRLCGIVPLGDIVTNDNTKDAENATKDISAKQNNVA